MKWSDIREKSNKKNIPNSFWANYEMILGLILDKKNEYPFIVRYHIFDYEDPRGWHNHENFVRFTFDTLLQETLYNDEQFKYYIHCHDNHCEATATYGNLVMYKNFLTGEEWFKE